MTTPLVLDLSDARAVDPARAGAKAANLARAAAAGLPVLPGFVVTTDATADGLGATARSQARDAWAALGGSVVVRSSSTVEDAESSSMAGQFTSVLGVADAVAFDHAIDRVLASGRAPKSGTAGRPMAVLVQRELAPVSGGVAFGLDPVTGDRRVCAIDAVRGSPESVVSGRALAAHIVVSRRGRIRSWIGPPLDDVLPPEHLRAVARLAREAAAVFGGPQDIEWAIDADGALWLLQSRPVTASAASAPRGPIYGPGPLIETFPDALATLEVELWIEPLREAIAAALGVVGVIPARRIRESEVVVVVGGRPAIDLDLIGATPHHGGLRRLSPLRGGRRLVAAWRTGRLRAALPLLVTDLLEAVDRELMHLPRLDAIDDRELVEILGSSVTDLRALHGYEVLCGMLLDGDAGPSAAGIALRAVARGRRAGMSDDEIVAADPVTLALIGPRIGIAPQLPAVANLTASGASVGELLPREALRLRCRWLQELGARVAVEVAARAARAGVLDDAARVRELTLSSLALAVEGIAVRAPDEPFVAGPPLPTMFRLDARRTPVDQRPSASVGTAASVGRASGIVRHVSTPPTPGRRDVLVVDALAPELAAELGHVAAIVSETGSPLSHLAILARELSIPVAVGVEDARARFPEGSRVLVDGGTGSVITESDAVAS